MTLILYAHPFSSYCWKALIALWENDIPFDYRRIDDPAHHAAWERAAPFKRMPLLIDGETIVHESSIIIEHLQIHHRGSVALVPLDAATALNVRLLDRLSDHYLMAPMQQIVFDQTRKEDDRDPVGVAQSRDALDRAYAWWDAHNEGP